MSTGNKTVIENALEMGKGIMRLAPVWVPRFYCIPGKRIKLHPDDYYSYGLNRGGIDERWFASTTFADNGPGTPEDEGLSYVVFEYKGETKRVLLREAVELMKDQIVGERIWNKYNRWPIYSKFFDNFGPLPHHVHHNDKFAALTGKFGKPEMYYFPIQVNNYGGTFPFTFFGLNPETTKDMLKECLINFPKGDNKILDLSRSYKLRPGTGWDVPPGVLHAPGSLCTYEPQFASDVFAMYQSVLYGGECVPESLLWKETPEDKIGNIDHLIDVLDWEINVDPDFHKNRFMEPKPVQERNNPAADGFYEKWICFKSQSASAKELTVLPGQTVTIPDSAAYGFILMEGFGTINGLPLETPSIIRFGQLTYDEYFVTEAAAKKGVVIKNNSVSQPIVMLKHFGPENPELIL
ncbi:MAG: hypothetical protein WCI88_04580 [Chloroflexota bacterium]